MQPFTYWRATLGADGIEPRWSVGQWGPRYIVQCETETDIRALVDALNRDTGACDCGNNARFPGPTVWCPHTGWRDR